MHLHRQKFATKMQATGAAAEVVVAFNKELRAVLQDIVMREFCSAK